MLTQAEGGEDTSEHVYDIFKEPENCTSICEKIEDRQMKPVDIYLEHCNKYAVDNLEHPRVRLENYKFDIDGGEDDDRKHLTYQAIDFIRELQKDGNSDKWVNQMFYFIKFVFVNGKIRLLVKTSNSIIPSLEHAERLSEQPQNSARSSSRARKREPMTSLHYKTIKIFDDFRIKDKDCN